jgi:hypothetical protein
MTLRPLNRADLTAVAANMRAADRSEIFATRFDEDAELLAEECLASDSLGAILADRDGIPVAAIGAWEMWPGVWSVWMFATPSWPKVALSATRFVKRKLQPALLALGAHRAECRSSATHCNAHRWLHCLGAEIEAEYRDFGKNREIFIGFVWRKENVLKSVQESETAQDRKAGGPAKG